MQSFYLILVILFINSVFERIVCIKYLLVYLTCENRYLCNRFLNLKGDGIVISYAMVSYWEL